MKKIICIIIPFILAASLCACSSAAPAASSEANAGAAEFPASSTAPAGSAAPAPAAEPEMAYDGNGDFGLRGSYEAGEGYLVIDENREKLAENDSLVTFSLKVDTASYTNVQRYIESGSLPPRDAVRTEELVNYFKYETAMEFGRDPFAVYTELGPSPFDPEKYLAFIRVKAKDIDKSELPRSNLVFLIDTSGSMESYDKLPLLQDSFEQLAETLGKDDRVSIVTYAGSSSVALDSVSGAEKSRIIDAIHSLSAGGSTAGAEGIQTAYRLAERNFINGGNNRVILATDGDFNVGISDINELARFISGKRDGGVYLSVLGFGTGNIRDDIMETLSKNGNGNYSYINSAATAKKVLVDELGSNLFTVADDVKAQIEFNPSNIKSYRLIGYENRRLQNEDFEDDAKDAGEIGAGADVVLLFELEPQNGSGGLKYASAQEPSPGGGSYGDELFEVRVRYKNPGETESRLVTQPVTFGRIATRNSDDFGFASAAAAFGHLLRDSEYSGDVRLADVISMARENTGLDREGYRRAFVELLRRYEDLAG